MSSQDPVRVVHIDPGGFGDVTVERELFKQELDAVDFEAVDTEGDAIAEDVGRADILLTHYAAVPAAVMDTTGCSVVASYSTGVDNVDVDAATEHGVAVTNVPEYCNEEVGGHTVTSHSRCFAVFPSTTPRLLPVAGTGARSRPYGRRQI